MGHFVKMPLAILNLQNSFNWQLVSIINFMYVNCLLCCQDLFDSNTQPRTKCDKLWKYCG